MKICYAIEIGGLPIELAQRGRDSFRVTYWKQVKDRLTYAEAAKELGECILHALACESLLDNRVKGERA